MGKPESRLMKTGIITSEGRPKREWHRKFVKCPFGEGIPMLSIRLMHIIKGNTDGTMLLNQIFKWLYAEDTARDGNNMKKSITAKAVMKTMIFLKDIYITPFVKVVKYMPFKLYQYH